MSNKSILLFDGVHCYLETDGTAYLKLDDVARGLGFTTVATSGNEVIRWSRVRNYLKEFGFSQEVGKDAFIPEQIFYKLAMKANNDVAKTFQDKIAYDILPAIRKTGSYTVSSKEKEYQPKATSVGEVASLLKPVIRVMEKQGSRPYKIASQTERTLNQFGIETIPDFVEEPKEEEKKIKQMKLKYIAVADEDGSDN